MNQCHVKVLCSAMRPLRRYTTAETRPCIDASSTPLTVMTRSWQQHVVPTRTGDSAFWLGHQEMSETLLHAQAPAEAVLHAIRQLRGLRSPFSGAMELSVKGQTRCMQEITDLIRTGSPTCVEVRSETEALSDDDMWRAVEQIAEDPTSSTLPTTDSVIQWVVDNHALEGALTRSRDIIEARRDIATFRACHMAPKQRREIESALSMIDVMTSASTWSTDPITLGWFEGVHFELDEAGSFPGTYRYDLGLQEVEIRALRFAGFEFPKGKELQEGMHQLVDDVATIQRGAPDALRRAHDAQQRFVSLHPFMDGNGRISRMLWCRLLHRLGFPLAMYPRAARHVLMQAVYRSQVNNDFPPFHRLCNEAIWRAHHDPIVLSPMFEA